MASLYIRSFIFNIFFFLWTTLLTLVTFVIGIFGYMTTVFIAVLWGDGIIFAAKHILGITTEFRGMENIPKDRPYIFACKHQSAFDTVVIQHLAHRSAVILKHELLWIPVFGQVMMFAKAISLNRRKGRKIIPQLIEQAEKQVAMGRPIFMYPEGTRGQAGMRGKYKTGIAAVYEALNIPVIPAALNTGYFWPRRSFLKYPGHVVFEILPAIEPGLDQETFMKTLEDKIETACDRLPKRDMETKGENQ